MNVRELHERSQLLEVRLLCVREAREAAPHICHEDLRALQEAHATRRLLRPVVFVAKALEVLDNELEQRHRAAIRGAHAVHEEPVEFLKKRRETSSNGTGMKARMQQCTAHYYTTYAYTYERKARGTNIEQHGAGEVQAAHAFGEQWDRGARVGAQGARDLFSCRVAHPFG